MKAKTPWIWWAALGVFILAGSTGSLYRFGALYGLPAELWLANVRHAHSHLMYFGWATPALMGLIAAWLPRVTGRQTGPAIRRIMGATIGFALLAYIPFLLYGYQLAEIGSRRLPLSVMAATLNMLAWYGYIILYFRATRRAPRIRPLRFWDAALVFQCLASMGAWGVAVVSRLGVENPFWSEAMTHLFLDLFSEGWFVLAVLGLVYAAHPVPSQPGRQKAARWGEQLVVMGLPVIFFLFLPVNQVPSTIRVVAGIGGALVVTGLLLNVWVLWPVVPRKWVGWHIPLAFLTFKTIIGLGLVLPVTARWAQANALRIFYLHLLLLGFVTLGLIVAAREMWGRAAVPGHRWLVGAVLVLLATLFPLTGLWPESWGGRWVLQMAAWATLGPVLVAVGMMVTRVLRRQSL
jgi:hypothetical protein